MTTDPRAAASFDTLPDAAHVRLPVVATLYATSELWIGVEKGPR